MYRLLIAISSLACCCLAQPLAPQLLNNLDWRFIGPFRGGRVLAVTGVPGDTNTFYFGAVGGGVWKTTDAGIVWKPIFDHLPTAIASPPSEPSPSHPPTRA